MIFTLTPNPALDITYAVPLLHVGESHRVSVTGVHAGGKGLNVAGVLAGRGVPHVAIAPIGERQRDFFIVDAAQRGLRLRHVESPAATRRSVSVFSADGRATVLNEQGDVQPQEVWDEITAHSARWRQAFSLDGETWEENWVMEFRRVPGEAT